MKVISKLFLFVVALGMISCSAQRQLASRLTGEWLIEEYEVSMANGSETRMENAGTILFMSSGRGQQTFTSAISQIDASNTGDFRWDNNANVVFIWGQDAQYRKAWIIVESSRSKQLWRSTDSEGNVQTMVLTRKKE
ncbi:MAG: hypothetical protein V2I46_10590 [Bacteroides sp.]|jgi:hypothetical protein|nr:hypothetical protein [Bacteroides sp.]